MRVIQACGGILDSRDQGADGRLFVRFWINLREEACGGA
jgi:predicted acetyltransferase